MSAAPKQRAAEVIPDKTSRAGDNYLVAHFSVARLRQRVRRSGLSLKRLIPSERIAMPAASPDRKRLAGRPAALCPASRQKVAISIDAIKIMSERLLFILTSARSRYM